MSAKMSADLHSCSVILGALALINVNFSGDSAQTLDVMSAHSEQDSIKL